jgi:hypothetical protein
MKVWSVLHFRGTIADLRAELGVVLPKEDVMLAIRAGLLSVVGVFGLGACGGDADATSDAGGDAAADVHVDADGSDTIGASDTTSPDVTVDATDDTADGPDAAADADVSLDAADLGDAPPDVLPDVEGDVFPPRGHVAINFTVDDSANATYGPGDGLAWKGSFSFDPATSVITHDGSWAGPYPMLWDDGGWDAGGHEPQGQTAGDHVWGVTVWFARPSEPTTFEYGVISGSVEGGDGTWIWPGPNGSFDVPADASTAIDAPGMVIAEFGDIDLRLTIDLSGSGANLEPAFQGTDYTNVTVKSGAWGWREIPLSDDGTLGDVVADDKMMTFVFSNNLMPHTGLFREGDEAEFVFVFDGIEYRSGGVAGSAGVAAFSDYETRGTWAEEVIVISPIGNTRVTLGASE